MKKAAITLSILLTCVFSFAAEYHVSPKGSDTNPGTHEKPLKTISAAAVRAMPGDDIVVHEGTYREWIAPPRGGLSDDQRIVYRAAENEHVMIKGSEVIRDWQRVQGGVWKVRLPNTFFGAHNPYQILIEGDWFNDQGRQHHTGEVFLNGKALYEVTTLEQVESPSIHAESREPEASLYTWYCTSDEAYTNIYANFHAYDPNQELVEISVRKTCFYPEKPGVNFITIDGFHFSQAATQWAAPTAEQIGLIATHWNKGWIIENNTVSHSRCSGITLGKERSTGHNVWSNNPAKDGATHYNEVILRALEIGWSKENIGGHIVRNNEISYCEQTGICGSLGGVFSTIENNHIHDIWVKRQFTGAEIAGIKIHAPIDMVIKDNLIHNVGRGLWMDWMAQGTRLSGNACFDNTTDDLFVEVNHGPFLVDNNIFLSPLSIRDWSEGGAFAHNLIAGEIEFRPVPSRTTPYHHAHSTAMQGYKHIVGGDHRYFNNLFVQAHPPSGRSGSARGYGLAVYENIAQPVHTFGNVYLGGPVPIGDETGNLHLPSFSSGVQIRKHPHGWSLEYVLPMEISQVPTRMVTTDILGTPIISNHRFENPDGTPVRIAMDFSNDPRDAEQPAPGPFENTAPGKKHLPIWPK
jgi:hypothetical protein